MWAARSDGGDVGGGEGLLGQEGPLEGQEETDV